MKKLFATMLFLFCSCAYGQNVVTDWAAIVQPAVNTPPKPRAIEFVLRATIQLAMYDAAMAIQGGFEPYAAVISAPVGADVRAAVATAAYLTARARVDASQVPYLDTQYGAYMAGIADGQAKSDGVLVGEIAATAILALRVNDGLSNVVLYQCSSNPPPAGEFEPDGGCGTQPVGVNVGQITPFTFRNPSRFRPDGPNPLTSNAYTEDFIETRDYGRFDSTFRSPEQTDIAYFWQAADVHRGVIDLAVTHGLNVRDAARFFALVYTAAADANIAGFETKYFYRHWRPRTAIPQADTDGNPDTDPDPTWVPLLTVNHPEYPSAHSYSSTAFTDTIARFFGTNKVTWTLTASKAVIPQLVQTERTYRDMNSVMREIDDARVWAGLHWRHSMRHGGQIGRKVAKHVFDNFFRPAP
jgi:PAP2 superfamily